MKPAIYFDGIEIQRMQNGAFFLVNVPTGKHMITAGRSEVGQFVNLDAGKKYFFRFDHRNWAGNAISGRQPIFLTPVSEDQAKSEMLGLKSVAVPDSVDLRH